MNIQDQWITKVHESSSLRNDFLASEVRIAYLSMEYVFRKFVDKKLAPTHATLLWLIDKYPDSTQQYLSTTVGLQRSTMTRTIDEFERKGWAKRLKVEGNRRSLAIRITPKGKKILARIKPKLLAIEDHLSKSLGPGKREDLMQLLRQFQDALWKY